MRPVLHGDLVALAAAIGAQEPGARDQLALRLISRAHAADLYRKRTGRAHPLWGNGSLMSAVLLSGLARPGADPASEAALAALADATEAVLAWKARMRPGGARLTKREHPDHSISFSGACPICYEAGLKRGVRTWPKRNAW